MIIELRVVLRLLGYLTLVLAALILATAVFGSVEAVVRDDVDRSAPVAMLIATVITAISGIVFYLAGKKGSELIGQREALLMVALGWIVGAAFAALPFWVWSMLRPDTEVSHNFDSFVNCYFESMSGLTTTGATIVEHISTLPRTLLLWRALTHWLGGLGIVVLFVAVLPMLGVGSRRLYRIEAAGPTPEGVVPRIQDAAQALWKIYFGLTLVEIIALMLCGMTWFDATCHTFATLATGGFSTLDASIAGYDSTAIHLVIILFMIIAGINFSLYHQLMLKQWKSVFKDPELRVYFSIILVATTIITCSLLMQQSASTVANAENPSLGITVRDSLFQVVAVQTTTGFVSADFDKWGFTAKATLLILMFVGGMAGSTGGGIKVVRIITAVKVMFSELEHVYRPRVVRTVRIGKTTIDPELRLNTMVYLVAIALLFGLGTILLMWTEKDLDITTAATASIATLNNIGPGLARVGATHNYAWFTDSSKMIMCVLMVLGRLEMFTILALFTPRFWRSE